MKQHITIEDISELTESQRENLRDLWVPMKYDIAVALVCTDVINEEYNAVEFVIGEVEFAEINKDKKQDVTKYPAAYNYQKAILHALKMSEAEYFNESSLDEDSAEDYEEEDEQGYEEEDTENCEEDEDYHIFMMDDYYDKETCLPLLSIGQMIEILQEKGFDIADFFITPYESRNDYNSPMTVGTGRESMELCDVLWDAVKSLLE